MHNLLGSAQKKTTPGPHVSPTPGDMGQLSEDCGVTYWYQSSRKNKNPGEEGYRRSRVRTTMRRKRMHMPQFMQFQVLPTAGRV